MEELILPYYLKVFSIFLFIILLLFCSYIYYTLNKTIYLKNNLITINKGDKIEKVIKKNITNYSNLETFIIIKYYQVNYILFNKFIHFGDFFLEKNISLFDFLGTISKSSNILNKITIVEGWSLAQLNNELSKYFANFDNISYENVIADTYFFQKNIDYNHFRKNLINVKENYFKKYKNNFLTQLLSEKEIMIIGSLIEKEALDREDKLKISSVIFNRLKKNMKLQIDATVLFAITKGKYNLNRKLFISDYKYEHPYNTYRIYGLPPSPISYVGKETIDVIFENYQTDFLFYFFNKSLNRHIFSKTFDEHKRKLNEYRKNK